MFRDGVRDVFFPYGTYWMRVASQPDKLQLTLPLQICAIGTPPVGICSDLLRDLLKGKRRGVSPGVSFV